jgi:hypothetical protein
LGTLGASTVYHTTGPHTWSKRKNKTAGREEEICAVVVLLRLTPVEPGEEELDLVSCLVCRLPLFCGEESQLVATAMTFL